MDAPAQWQRWTITIPASKHEATNTTVITTAPVAFDAYVHNLYSDESMMRLLVARAECDAVMEYGDPPGVDAVLRVRRGLHELLERPHGETAAFYALEAVADRWDEYEQEIGTDQVEDAR